MCYGRGNCEGDCEATAVHLHPCPVSGCVSMTDCTDVDCDERGGLLCDDHATYQLCDWCLDYVAKLVPVVGGEACAFCASSLNDDDMDATDAACDGADHANKDEKES